MQVDPGKAQPFRDTWRRQCESLDHDPKSLYGRYCEALPDSLRLEALAYADWEEIKAVWNTSSSERGQSRMTRLEELLSKFVDPVIDDWSPLIRIPYERDATPEERELLRAYRKQLMDAHIKHFILDQDVSS